MSWYQGTKRFILHCWGFFKSFNISFDTFCIKITWNKLDPILHALILLEFILLLQQRKYSKSIKGRDWPEYHITTKDKDPWENLSTMKLYIVLPTFYFITSLSCRNLLRYCEKQRKCNWKSNTNIVAFYAFQNHLMQWYCKKYWGLPESSILRPSLLFVFRISSITYFFTKLQTIWYWNLLHISPLRFLQEILQCE